MLVKGDKIKLVKAMGCFDNIGEVCEVVNISEDAAISFKFGEMHLGCMSYNEFKKYFEKVENAKHEWTKWTRLERRVEYYNIDNDLVEAAVEYRQNGLRVQVRAKDLSEKEYIKARSSCHKNDAFDLSKGLKIAIARLVVKFLDEETKNMAKNM
jgi:hypothetical protein